MQAELPVLSAYLPASQVIPAQSDRRRAEIGHCRRKGLMAVKAVGAALRQWPAERADRLGPTQTQRSDK